MATATETKSAEETLESLQTQLSEAEQAEEDARSAHELASGRAILGELSSEQVAGASEAWQLAQARTAALRSAMSLLTERQDEQEKAQAAEQVNRLRKESDRANIAQASALSRAAEAAAEMADAIDTVKAQGAILTGIHGQLTAADPDRWAEVNADHRSALAAVHRDAERRRASIMEQAASAQYRLQAPGDGTDPVLEADLVLGPEDQVAAKGTRYSDARPAVTGWQVEALAELDAHEQASIEEEAADHAARALVAGFGNLPLSASEVREAVALDIHTVSVLVPEKVARALRGLESYLPANAIQGVSVRSVPRSALEARQNEQALQAAKEAIGALIGQ